MNSKVTEIIVERPTRMKISNNFWDSKKHVKAKEEWACRRCDLILCRAPH